MVDVRQPGVAGSAWWVEAGDAPRRPPLSGEIQADVAVIGAGLTGTSAAWHLALRRPDLRVVVLEAGRIGGGASGRSGGQVLHWINGADPEGEDETRRQWAVTEAAIDLVEALHRDHGVRAGFLRDGSLEVFTHPGRAEGAAAWAEKVSGWGIPLRFIPPSELPERLRFQGAAGAVLDPRAGRVNSLLLARGMADLAEAQGVDLYEGTPALGITEGPTHEITTPAGRVRAPALILATNGYSHKLGYFKSGVFPLHSHMIATEPLDEAQRGALGWGSLAAFNDDMDRIAYGTVSPGGRLLFGGGSNAAYAYRYGGPTEWTGGDAGHRAVHRHLARRLPEIAERPFPHQWTGTLGITLTRLYGVGVMGDHRNVYYALGYSGHGVALATLSGRMLADLYCGEGDQWADLPCWMHRPGGIPPDPLRWLGYHVFTALTGRSPRKAR